MAASSGTVTVKLSGDAKGLLGVFQEVAAASSGVSDEVKAKFAEAAAAVDAMMADLRAQADAARDQAVAAMAQVDAARATSDNNASNGLTQRTQLIDRFRHSTDDADESLKRMNNDGEQGGHRLLESIGALSPALVGIGQVASAIGVGLAGTFGAAAGGLAIFKLASGQVATQAKTDATTVLASWQTAMAPFVQGVYTKAVGLVKQGLVDITPVVKPVSDALQGLEADFQKVLGSTATVKGFQAFGQQAAQAINAIGPALANIVPFALNLFEAMNPLTVVVETFIKGIGPQLPALASALQGPFASLATTFEQIGPSVSNIFHELGSTVGQLLSALAPLAPVVLNVVDAFLGIISADIAPVIVTLAQSFGRILQAVTPLLTPLGQIVQLLAGALSNAIVTVVGPLTKLVGVLATSLGPVLKPIATLIGDLASVFAGVLGSAIAQFVPIFARLAPVAAQFAGALASALIPVLKDLTPAFNALLPLTNVFPVLAKTVTDVMPSFEKLLPAIAQLAKPLADLFTQLSTQDAQIIEKLLPPLGKLAETFANDLAPVIVKLAPDLTKLIGSLSGGFGDILGTLAGAVGKLAGPLGDVAVALGQTIVKAVTDLEPMFEQLAPTALDIAKALGDMADSVGAALAPVIQQLAPVIDDLIKQLVTEFAPILAQLGPIIGQLAKPMGDLIVSLGRDLVPIVKALGPLLVQLAKGGLIQVFEATEPLIPPLLKLLDALVKISTPIIELYSIYLTGLIKGFTLLLTGVMDVSEAVTGTLGTVLAAVVSKISDVATWLATATTHLGGFKQAFTDAATWVGQKADAIVGFFTGLPTKIVNAIGSVASIGQHIITGITTALGSGLGSVLGFFSSLPTSIAGALSGLAGTLEGIFRTPFAAMAHLWNDTLGSISFKIPSFVPGIGGDGFSFPKIPGYAAGGILTKPTIAAIAEAGWPEAVVPLKNGLTPQGLALSFNQFLGGGSLQPAPAGRGANVTQNVTVYAPTNADPDQIANAVTFKLGRLVA